MRGGNGRSDIRRASGVVRHRPAQRALLGDFRDMSAIIVLEFFDFGIVAARGIPFPARWAASVSLGDYAAYGSLGSYGFFRGVFEGPLAKLAHAALYRMHEMDLYGPIRVVSRGWTTNLTRAVRLRIQLSWFPNGARSSAGRPGALTAGCPDAAQSELPCQAVWQFRREKASARSIRP